MKEILLTKKEIKILKNLANNLDKTETLYDMKKYWLLEGTTTDDRWWISAELTWDGKQLLRKLKKHEWPLDRLEITLNLGVIKISNK